MEMTNITNKVLKKYFIQEINKAKKLSKEDKSFRLFKNNSMSALEELLEKGFGATLQRYIINENEQDTEYTSCDSTLNCLDITPKLERCVPQCIVSFNELFSKVIQPIYIKYQIDATIDFWELFFTNKLVIAKSTCVVANYIRKCPGFIELAMTNQLSIDFSKENLKLNSNNQHIQTLIEKLPNI